MVFKLVTVKLSKRKKTVLRVFFFEISITLNRPQVRQNPWIFVPCLNFNNFFFMFSFKFRVNLLFCYKIDKLKNLYINA